MTTSLNRDRFCLGTEYQYTIILTALQDDIHSMVAVCSVLSTKISIRTLQDVCVEGGTGHFVAKEDVPRPTPILIPGNRDNDTITTTQEVSECEQWADEYLLDVENFSKIAEANGIFLSDTTRHMETIVFMG